MGVFQGLQPIFGKAIQDEIQNPYSSMFFNTQLAMGNQGLQAQESAGNQSMLQRARALGINPSSPLFAQMMAQQQRGQQGRQSNMFNNLLLQAGQLRQGAIGQAGAYRPMQTGETTTQKKSGLGTWLPQAIGAGLGIAGAAFGMPGLGGGMGGGGNADFGAAGGIMPQSGFNPGYSLPTQGIADPFGSGGPSNTYNPFLH